LDDGPTVYPDDMFCVRLVAFLTVVGALSAPAQTLHLLPAPREVQAGGLQPLPQGIHLTCTSCFTDAEDTFTVQDLTQTLAARGIPSGGNFTVSLTRTQNLPEEMKAEGYTITPGQGANSLVLAASTSAGLFYAAQTLKQMIEHDGAAAVLHVATIRDWPAMKYRGLHDDLSRGPVPTLAFQKHLIRTLAAYKVNIYSPYFEHTQQYTSNPLPAPPGGSISAEDARAITAYAAQFHITIVPEQEAFGHLRHSLIWEQYQALAETPHGAVLTPTQPGSVELINQWFTELAAMYPGPFLHIGADETTDLGVGATKADVDTRGLPVVYLDFLQKIVTKLEPLHRKILFWGDIAQGSPDLLKAMPQSFKQQTIAVAWGYSPDPKGFGHILKPYTEAGFEVWAAPSINNYRQVYPNQQVALEDIQEFTRDAQRFGATGQLNTLWNDDGESLADQNWYGILFGAAAAWQAGESSIPAFQGSYAQVFHGDSTGLLNHAQMELTAAMAILHDAKVIGATEGTDGLFWVDPWSGTPVKDGQLFASRMRPISAKIRLHAEAAITLIAQARAAAPPVARAGENLGSGNDYASPATSLREPNAIDAMELGARRIDFLALKFQLADEITSAYALAYIAANSTDPKMHRTMYREMSDINGVNGRLQDITWGYSQLRDLYEQAWLRTNRPYGLRPVLEHYDYEVALWQGRIDKVRSAQRQMSETKLLPTAAEVGIPTPPQ
jgi:hexosaminidase